MLVQRIRSEGSMCDACAADLCESAVGAQTPLGVLVKRTFSSKVTVLRRREHRLFENQLGGVPISDFTLVARHAVTIVQAQRGGLQASPRPPTLMLLSWRVRL